METKKRQKFVYTISIIVAIWGLYNFLGDSKKPSKPTPVPDIMSQKTVVTSKAIKPANLDEYSDLEWGKDPFYWSRKETVKKETKKTASLGWTLGGILYNDQNPTAVINKKIVRHGDIVNGARVIKIEKKDVTLEKDRVQFTLNIEKDK
jgi:hypothetical protein